MIKEIHTQNCRYLIQNRREGELPATLSPATALGIRAFHRKLPGYKPTPLVRLERLARFWGYTEVPLWIMQGYLTTCAEVVDRLRAEDAYQHLCPGRGGSACRGRGGILGTGVPGTATQVHHHGTQ